LKWRNESYVTGPYGNSLWTHQVVIIVPKILQFGNVSIIELTSKCNKNPSLPTKYDMDILVEDEISMLSGVISVVIYQMPNCPLRFEFNPKHTFSEDGLVA